METIITSKFLTRLKVGLIKFMNILIIIGTLTAGFGIGYYVQEFKLIGFGAVFAFISAWFAVKFFLYFIQKYNFSYFGYYRIALGFIFILFYYA